VTAQMMLSHLIHVPLPASGVPSLASPLPSSLHFLYVQSPLVANLHLLSRIPDSSIEADWAASVFYSRRNELRSKS
jgi:hypothetical protein